MGLFWWKKGKVAEKIREHQLDPGSSIEVLDLKQAHKKADATKKDIEKLNRLLKNDGITLRIHIASTGGHKGVR